MGEVQSIFTSEEFEANDKKNNCLVLLSVRGEQGGGWRRCH